MQRIVHPLRGDDLIGRCPPFDPLHQREQDVVTRVGEPRNAVDDGAQHGLLVHAGEIPGRVRAGWGVGAVSFVVG